MTSAKKMRVLIDDQIFLIQEHGGVSRYFTELIREYRADPGLSVVAITPYRYVLNRHLLDLPSYRATPLRRGATQRLITRGINRMVERRAPVDLIHYTYYDQKRLVRGDMRKAVVTVYDMIPELIPSAFPRGNPHLDKREFVMRSEAIICISESTRKDLLMVYGPLDKPIEVIPLAPSRAIRNKAPGVKSLPKQFLLFVGARGGYKNFRTLLSAFGNVAKLERSLDLVCVGGPPFTPEETRQMARCGAAHHIHQLVATDAQLPSIYAAALAFIYPSTHEGFGLPILEAMSAGCPTVLADIPVFREVAGGACIFFPAHDVDFLAASLLRVLHDEELRQRVIAKGLEHVGMFSWRRTAMATAEVYASVLAD